jgi:hypothetical protein
MTGAALIRWTARTAACAALCLSASCGDVLGSLGFARPELSRLSISDSFARLVQGGLLYVDGFPVDTSFRLDRRDRVLVELVTSAGDRETLNLFRAKCPPRARGPYYECFQYSMMMRGGSTAQDVAPLVQAAGDRFTYVSESGALANVTVFDAGATIPHAQAARIWPGVSLVLLSQTAWPAEAPPPSDRRGWLRAPMRVDSGAVRLADGVLQVRSGDTIRARYTQPSGSVLTSPPAIVP